MYGIVKFYLKTNNYTKQEMKITYICIAANSLSKH